MLKGFSCNALRVIIAVFSVLLYLSLSHASTNIPLNSPFYRDIDTLIAQGLIKSDLSSTRPFTRAEAGRLLAEALYYSEIEDVPASISQLLDRMAKEYEEEISETRVRGSIPTTFLKPVDEFSLTYESLDGPFSIFNNEGIEYFDGSNAMAQFQARARLWRVFSFYIEPLFVYNENFTGIEGNEETELTLHKGYMKLTLGNFEIEAGRDSLWWSPGYHGALLISNNAPPFDMIKISNPRATLLPSFLSGLGPFKYNLFFSELDGAAASGHPPDSRLFGARFDFKPHPLFEFGISYLAHFGGERPGIEDLDLWDYLDIIFSNESREGDKRDANKEFAVDAALTLPNMSNMVPFADSIKLYAEWGAEDSDYPPDRRAYLLGVAFNDLFTAQGLKLRAEYARLSPESVPGAWYEHPIWPMRYYGRVFGHHAGTDSDDLFVELSHAIKGKFLYKLGFDRERGGLSKPYPQEKDQYFLEAGYNLGWTNFMVRYGHEEINNLGNVKDSKQENHLIGAELTFRF